jgi:hypothetical protein
MNRRRGTGTTLTTGWSAALVRVGVALAFSACSNEGLRALSQEPVFERQSIEGEICAPPYVDVDVPYRVLFVIDTSLSNEWNDPTKRRVEAVKKAINDNLPNPNVSFGVITFSDAPRVQTLSFTRDLVSLGGATKNIGIAQGATNYSDSLWMAKTFIMEDLNSLTRAQAARTHYLVFWLTDGFPTVGTTDPGSLLLMTEAWRALLKDRVAEFRLDTAFLGARSSSAAEAAELEAARTLLKDMAAAGGGNFNDVAKGASFQFSIDLQKSRAFFQLENVVVGNRNVVLDDRWPSPDSDGDGLSDDDEEALGLDPLLDDSDGDGYRDGVEWLSGAKLDPRAANTGCSDTRDSDGDGLYDCEEHALGTSPTKQDTDQDLLPDALEVLMGSSATDERSTTDRDSDGLADQVEVRTHLRPALPTQSEHAKRWGYTYVISQLPSATPGDPSCYRVKVGNLTMAPTRATGKSASGANTFEIMAGFALEGGLEPRWYSARVEGRLLREPYVSVPANGRFELETTAFQKLP